MANQQNVTQKSPPPSETANAASGQQPASGGGESGAGESGAGEKAPSNSAENPSAGPTVTPTVTETAPSSAFSRRSPRDLAGVAQDIRRKAVSAGPCPESPNHKNTRVYSTKGRTRFCVCDDCGATYKRTGEFSERWREYCMKLAESISQSPRTDTPAGKVIVIPEADAIEIAKKLTQLVEMAAE